jgi:MSHA biogenesis protein MshQ
VVFSTSVTGVTASNFALVQAGGVTGATITSVTGAGTTWTVNANTGTGTGTLGLNMVNATGVSPALTNLPFNGDVYTVSVVPPGTQPFDAVEVGGAIGSPIRTKIAGQAFNLDVLAVNNGAIDTRYKRTPVVDLIAGAALCDQATPALAGVTVTPVGYKYTRGCGNCDNGRHTYTFTSPDAYPNARVRVQDNNGNLGCSFDSFAIRPSSLANLTVSDTDWTTAGARVLNNTSATGPGCSAVNTPAGCTGTIHKAGQPFTVSATAVNAAAATTTNYVGTPNALLTACAGTACAAVFGTFSVGTAAAAGVINSSTATYSEAGSFALQLQDQTFANVDAADSTTAERYFSSAVINVGRFVPDHFDTLVTAPMTCTGLTFTPASACPFNGLVYSGQPFIVNVYARNAAGGTAANYDNTLGLSKLVTLSAWDAPGSTTTQNPGGGAVTSSAVAATAFGAGIAIATTPAYSFNARPTAPTDIYLRALDADDVTSLRAPANTSVEGGTRVASGRIKISNAYGSELLQLSVAMTAQYWKDATSGWMASSTDSSSSFVVATPPATSALTFAAPPPPVVSVLGAVSVVGSPKTVTLVGGVGGFSLAAPGAGISGSVDMSIPVLIGAGCSVVSVPLGCYLPANSARATFGVYKGRKEFIYLRENY